MDTDEYMSAGRHYARSRWNRAHASPYQRQTVKDACRKHAPCLAMRSILRTGDRWTKMTPPQRPVVPIRSHSNATASTSAARAARHFYIIRSASRCTCQHSPAALRSVNTCNLLRVGWHLAVARGCTGSERGAGAGRRGRNYWCLRNLLRHVGFHWGCLRVDRH